MIFKESEFENLNISSIYNLNKINNLFKNFDTMSFVELVFNYTNLIEAGYNKNFLNQSLHSLLILPLFLLLMTGLASILAPLNNFKQKQS